MEKGVCFICGCCSDYFNVTEIPNPHPETIRGEFVEVCLCDLCYTVIRSGKKEAIWIKCRTCGAYGALKNSDETRNRLILTQYLIGFHNQVAIMDCCSQCAILPPNPLDVIH